MSYDSSTTIITNSPSIADVKQATGETSNDLGVVCKSNKINPWSRRKPIRNSSITPLSESNFATNKYGFGADSAQFSRIFKTLSTSNLYGNYPVTSLLPTGGTETPYRLSDFDGYKHNAPSLFEVQTLHPKYNTSLTKNKWCYSTIRDATNKKNAATTEIYELVNSNDYEYLHNPQSITTTFSYTDGVIKYREIELRNVLSFNTLSNTITNPSKTDNLTLSEIGLSNNSTFDNYAFGLIITVGGNNYLYNTKFTISKLYSGSQNAADNKSRIFLSPSASGEEILAQKTANSFDIRIPPWLLALRSENGTAFTIDNRTEYYYSFSSSNNILANVSDGTTIKTRLCLCQALLNDHNLNSYFGYITQSTPTLYSCEFKPNQNMQNVVYRKYSTSSLPNQNEAYTLVNPTFTQSGIPSLGTYTTRNISVSRSAGSGSSYWFNIKSLLTYINSVYIYIGYLKENRTSHSDTTGEPYYGISSGYYTFDKVSHTSSTSSSKSLKVSLEYNLGSATISGTRWYDSNNSQISSAVTDYYNVNGAVSVLLAGGSDNSPDLRVDKTFTSTSNVASSSYQNYTDIIGGSTSIDSTIYVMIGGSARQVSKWELLMTPSQFNQMVVTIKIKCNNSEVVTISKTMAQIYGAQS